MLNGLPFTLWRMLAGEMLRLMLLTAAAVVVVIAFVAAAQPLANGQVDVGDALRLFVLAVVPMLQFALPFAAGFAATLVYHRFASDQEATASMASGISHRALIAPAALCGLTLAGLMVVLTHAVIPGFLMSMERIVARDSARVLIGAIERGQPLGRDFHIHASQGVYQSQTAPPPAREHVVLEGVLAVQTGDRGQVLRVFNAPRVDMYLFDDVAEPGSPGKPSQPVTTVQLIFRDAVVQDAASGELRQETTATRRIRLPAAFRDDPKFCTLERLLELRRNPDLLPQVETLRRAAASRLALSVMLDAADRSLRESGRAVLQRGARERLVLRGASLDPVPLAAPDEPARWTVSAGADGGVSLLWQRDDAPAIEQRCDSAWIVLDEGAAAGATAGLRLVLDNVVSFDAASGEAQSQSARAEFGGLVAGDTAERDRTLNLSGQELAEEARGLESAGQVSGAETPGSLSASIGLRRAVQRYAERADSLRREVLGKLHERAAFSAGCLLMVLTGSIVALQGRDRLPLGVYLWSFFPALIALITISSGQDLTHQMGPPGLFLLWGGVAGLAVFTLVAMIRLVRR